MYIIDEGYFVRELVIPNTSEIDVDSKSVPFASWVDEMSRLCLQGALGNVLFNEFDSNVTNGVLDDDADQKWKDLVNGKDYEKDGVTYTWKGLKYSEGGFNGSLLAYFVYCKWLEYQLSHQSGIGEVRGMAINSTNVGTTHRYVTTWNKFVAMYQGTTSNDAKITFYKGTPVIDYYGERKNGYVSLLQYLSDNEDDYPDAYMLGYDYLNTFGI